MVIFDSLLLQDVCKILNDHAKRNDPEKQGVQFDAGTLQHTIIKLTPARKNLSITEILKAICISTDPPIGYRVEGEKVVFLTVAKPTPAPPKKR